MDPLPELVEGEGLVLRRWTPDDALVLGALVRANVDHLQGYMPWVAEEPLPGPRRLDLLQDWEIRWRAGGDCVYGIYEDGVPVGGTGLHTRLGPTALEIGYWVDHEHLGRSIARRASTVLTSTAFEQPGIEFVEIHHDLTNTHSRRVPEQLGFHFVGQVTVDRVLAPNECGIDLAWRMSRPEWLARTGAATT